MYIAVHFFGSLVLMLFATCFIFVFKAEIIKQGKRKRFNFGFFVALFFLGVVLFPSNFLDGHLFIKKNICRGCLNGQKMRKERKKKRTVRRFWFIDRTTILKRLSK